MPTKHNTPAPPRSSRILKLSASIIIGGITLMTHNATPMLRHSE